MAEDLFYYFLKLRPVSLRFLVLSAHIITMTMKEKIVSRLLMSQLNYYVDGLDNVKVVSQKFFFYKIALLKY